MKRKIVALIQWWLQLEPVDHRHWCLLGDDHPHCEHQHAAWHCTGALCINQERKDCPGCELGQPCEPIPLEKRSYLTKCPCGLGS